MSNNKEHPRSIINFSSSSQQRYDLTFFLSTIIFLFFSFFFPLHSLGKRLPPILFIAVSSRLRLLKLTLLSRYSVSPPREKRCLHFFDVGWNWSKGTFTPTFIPVSDKLPSLPPRGLSILFIHFRIFLLLIPRESCDQATVGDPVYQKIRRSTGCPISCGVEKKEQRDIVGYGAFTINIRQTSDTYVRTFFSNSILQQSSRYYKLILYKNEKRLPLFKFRLFA